MSSLNPLEQSILRTLAYFDTFDYPLTETELWRWVYPPDQAARVPTELADVQQALRQPPLQQRVAQRDNFVFLRGRESLVPLRHQRKQDNQRRWRRAKTVARYVEILPFVRMVAVVNTLAIDNARPASDIDLLIVIQAGRMWLARMAVSAVVQMLGYRRHGTKIANRVCLSFYLSTEALDLEPLAASANDTHFRFWTSQAVPLLNIGQTYEKFQTANAWVTQRLPNAWQWDWRSRVLAPNQGLRTLKAVYETVLLSPLGEWLENWARSFQQRRFAKDTESKSHQPGTDVVISEDVLKFHEADRRTEYNQRFARRLQALGLDV